MDTKTRKAFTVTERELHNTARRIHKALNYGAVVRYSDEYNALDELQHAINKAIGICSLAIDPPANVDK